VCLRIEVTMTFPMTLARFNRRVTNRVARRFAGHIPPLANLEHDGRRSGKLHRTPVVVFRDGDDGFVVALTYGPGTDWVRNVLAAGGCIIESGSRHIALTAPHLTSGIPGPPIPAPIRLVLRLLHVTDYLQLPRAV